MTTIPTISAVIPCYNGAPFLRETIDSTLNQTSPPLEVIVVDDGSTDDSAAIAQTYGSPVRVIRQENQGESVARNRGMDEAQGEWVALLDADDRWLPHKLEQEIAALREAPQEVVCVYSDFVVFGSVRRQVVSCPMWPVAAERRVRRLTNPSILPGTAVIQTSVARKVRFPVGISHGEDQVFFMKLSDHGAILHVPESLTEYRKHAHQQTSQTGHGLRVVAALWGWAKEHPEEFCAEEMLLLRRVFAELIVIRHDIAFWHSDVDTVARARALYLEVAPESMPLPPCFGRQAPTLAMRAMYNTWNGLLDVLPARLGQGLVRVSRGMVDRLKRGRTAT
jgi:glycosyltransferase involved in cell wall biosynthesis